MTKGKILVIQTAFIGDCILSLPAIQNLKINFPENLIDIITIQNSSEIFSASPYINNVYLFDKRGKHKSLFAVRQYAKDLSKNNYSQIFSFHRSMRTSLLVKFMGVENTVGFDTSSLSLFYNQKVRYRKDFHEVRRLLELVGMKTTEENWKVLPELNLPEIKTEIMDRLTSQQKRKYVVLAPGSVWETKKAPIEKFKISANYLNKCGYNIVLLGGSSDESLCREIAKDKDDQIFSLAGKLSLLESISILKNAELLISNDSSPTHMGMCVDIPVLTIYCSTTPDFGFFPYNKKSDIISLTDIDCKPCGIHGHKSCPINNFRCGEEIQEKTIIDKIDKILAQGKSIK